MLRSLSTSLQIVPNRRRQEYVSCIDINQVSAGSAKATFGNKVTFQVKLVCQNVQLC